MAILSKKQHVIDGQRVDNVFALPDEGSNSLTVEENDKNSFHMLNNNNSYFSTSNKHSNPYESCTRKVFVGGLPSNVNKSKINVINI